MHCFTLSVVLLLGAAVKMGDAVKCYKCTSGFDTGCGIPFNPKDLQTCTGQICSLVDTRVKGVRHISRGCHQFTPGQKEDTCTKRNSTTTCYCHTAYCNKHGVVDWGSGSPGSRACVLTNILLVLTCFVTFSLH